MLYGRVNTDIRYPAVHRANSSAGSVSRAFSAFVLLPSVRLYLIQSVAVAIAMPANFINSDQRSTFDRSFSSPCAQRDGELRVSRNPVSS